LNSIPKI